MGNGIDGVHRRAREAARLEGRVEGSADARDIVLRELASSAAPEPLRSVLLRVLDELVERHKREHVQALERFVSEARGSWGEKEQQP